VTAAISGVFARSAPYFYVSSTDSITVYDVSDPLNPLPKGVLANLVFENEAMNYGQKKVDGVVNRFVLVGADLVEYSPTSDPSHLGTFNELLVVDVTDPTNPYVRSRLKTSTNTHTVSCINETDCQYAYTAGSSGQYSIVDLSNLDSPREVGVFASPAARPKPPFASGAGHKWNFDDAGYGHPHRLERQCRQRVRPDSTTPGRHHRRQRAEWPVERLHPPQLGPAQRLEVRCGVSALRPGACSPGRSPASTARRAPSTRWTGSTRSTSVRASPHRTWRSRVGCG